MSQSVVHSFEHAGERHANLIGAHYVSQIRQKQELFITELWAKKEYGPYLDKIEIVSTMVSYLKKKIVFWTKPITMFSYNNKIVPGRVHFLFLPRGVHY